MNTVTTISNREAVPVSIGTLTLWCEGFKAAAVRSFTEEPLVSGGETITNTCPRAMKLTFSGRIYAAGSDPLGFVRTASDMLRGDQSYAVSYRGLKFAGCRVQSFNAEDRGDEFIQAVISLITADAVGEEESS